MTRSAGLLPACGAGSGDRDPFGSPEVFRAELSASAGPVTLALVAGQGHDPDAAADPAVSASVKAFLGTI